MLGYDKDKDVILICFLLKDDVLRGDIFEYVRYNISVNVFYGRIVNKVFIS